MAESTRTLILIKPDAFDRGLTGEAIARFERKGLRPVALKLLTADQALPNEHYAEHAERPFFGELVEFITGGPLVAMVLEGVEAVRAALSRLRDALEEALEQSLAGGDDETLTTLEALGVKI